MKNRKGFPFVEILIGVVIAAIIGVMAFFNIKTEDAKRQQQKNDATTMPAKAVTEPAERR